MGEPLYSKPLRALDLRLIFWLLGHQAKDDSGLPSGVVRGPWRERARADLNTFRPQIWRAERRLREAGVLYSAPRSKDALIDGRAFE